MLARMVCSEEFRAKTNVGTSVAIELPLKYDAVNACDEVIAYDADIELSAVVAYEAVPCRDPVIPLSTTSDPDTIVLPLIIVVEPLTTVDPKLGAGE
jgi:hypothetical protein